MTAITPQTLYKTAAVLYALMVPGHVMMGYQVIFPALAKIPISKLDDRVGRVGSTNSWNFVASALTISALLHYQWSQTFGPRTLVETAVFVLTNGHFSFSALRYLQNGEPKAGLALWAAAGVGFAAYILQILGK